MVSWVKSFESSILWFSNTQWYSGQFVHLCALIPYLLWLTLVRYTAILSLMKLCAKALRIISVSLFIYFIYQKERVQQSCWRPPTILRAAYARLRGEIDAIVGWVNQALGFARPCYFVRHCHVAKRPDLPDVVHLYTCDFKFAQGACLLCFVKCKLSFSFK